MRRIQILWIAAILMVSLFSSCAGNRQATHDEMTWQEQYDLGLQYLLEGNYEEVVLAFTTAIEIEPKQVMPYIKLYESYVQMGEDEEAVNILKQGYEATGDAELESLLFAYCRLDEDDLTTEKIDDSFYDENGNVQIEITYDLVKLPESLSSYEKINAALLADYQAFSAGDGNREELEAYLGDPYLPYNSTVALQTVYNDGDILSLHYTTSWYMGGVSNQDDYGLNFDLKTGQSLELQDLFNMSPDSLLWRIKSRIRKYAASALPNGLTYEAKQTIQAYTLDVLKYYISPNKELVICIPEYEIGSGADGSHTIQTGLYPDYDTNQEGFRIPNEYEYVVDFIGKTIQELIDDGLKPELEESMYFEGLYTGRMLRDGVVGYFTDCWYFTVEGIPAIFYTNSAAEGISLTDTVILVELLGADDVQIEAMPGINMVMSHSALESSIADSLEMYRADLQFYDGTARLSYYTTFKKDGNQIWIWRSEPSNDRIDVVTIIPLDCDHADGRWLAGQHITPIDAIEDMVLD